VGLPLFLGSVAVTSLIVHASILTHVNWFSGYWDGADKHMAMLSQPAVPAVPAMTKSDAAFTMTVAPVAATSAQPASFVITVTPNAAEAAAPQTVSVPVPLRTASTN